MRRQTEERKGILATLTRATKPLTAAEIQSCLGTTAHTATVYRALQDLVQLGEVRQVELGGRAARYELNTEHHHHIVCTTCGDIEDVHTEPRGLEKAALVESKKFKSVHAHSLEFFGVCKKCT
jgi:Fe2+ or Zn2+ uptake regulation protein